MSARQRRRALRAQLDERLRAVRARIAALPAVQQARRRRQRRRALSSAVLLLLLLFLRCDCGPGEAPAPVPPVVVVLDAGIKAPAVRVAKRPASNERLASSKRPGYDTGNQPTPAWLDDFRLQVAARSPRLALCFTGADRPGALRWNVALNPESGAVSDHLFEPVGPADLTTAQRDCLKKVLSNPSFHVAEADRRSVPPRVSLVIEF